jgi:hypothetical protein
VASQPAPGAHTLARDRAAPEPTSSSSAHPTGPRWTLAKVLPGAGASVRATVQVAAASQAARKASLAGWSRSTSSGTTGWATSAQPSARPVALQSSQGSQTASHPARPDPSQ